jgi:prophage regulatory protein
MPAKPKPKLNFDDLSDDAYVRQAQLIPDILPFSPATLWRQVKAGTFPPPVKLGPRMSGWRVGTVRAKLQSLMADAEVD